MEKDNYIADDNEFIRALVEEALADNMEHDSVRFTHTFVDVPLINVLGAIRAENQLEQTIDTRIFGAEPSVNNCRVYLTSILGGTILWMPQKLIYLASSISRELKTVAHWISVYENFTCFAYVRFDCGKCTEEVLDPVSYWTENILHGEDLIGKGKHLFNNYEKFKGFIKNLYKPRDEQLDFERIDDSLHGNNNSIIENIKNLICSVSQNGELYVKHFGNWSENE